MCLSVSLSVCVSVCLSVVHPLILQETGRKRLATFHDQTKSAIEYYRSAGLLATIDATKSIKDVYADIKACLGPSV